MPPPTSRRRLNRILAGILAAGWLGLEWQRPPSGACRPVVLRTAAAEASAARQHAAPPAAVAGGEAAPAWLTRASAAEVRPGMGPPDVPARSVAWLRVDRALGGDKRSPFWQRPGEGRLEVPLPEGGVATVVLDGSDMLGPDRFVSTGRVEGWPASRVWAAWNRGFLHLSLEDPVQGRIVLQPATAGLAQLYRVAPEKLPPCGGGRIPHRLAAPGAAAAAATVPPPPATAAADASGVEVHLLMLYTPSVLPAASAAERAAAVQTVFDVAVAKVNAALAASLVPVRIRLVGTAETRYDESGSAPSGVQDDALTALYLDDDGRMDEIHALRDAAGADVVALALGRADFASSGLSFLLADAGAWGNDRFAFSVVHYGSIAGTNVVAHELGHLFGCAHDRENATTAGAFPYSHGYRFVGADGRQYRDIMAYRPGTELPYFSNPAVVAPAPASAPLGIPAGTIGEANAALTIERTAFATAAYRLQTQDPAGRGSLINVATRAHVGTGDAVLIGGFVLHGEEPKTVLVRAAGPALAGFGVAGALADPVLRIHAGATLAAENDQWGLPAGPGEPASAAALAQAAVQVGAFPFAPGSADAAALVRLPGGAYTAVVEGAGAATGSALVEVYEVGRGAGRIVNLATRGFAGSAGREMVGGFVVEGAAGTTKRVLLRVLGPTLGRAPYFLTGVLDDPVLELRNAAGELLLSCDDWSADAVGGASPENDFRPALAHYDERQIFATGLAPGNRREPCLLVDLPPGGYTAIVRPFEQRSSDPQQDQPAVPGVGVIEVYEIAP